MISTIPSAFGKVPFRGDFVRLGERAPELLELDGWFQEGIHRAQQAAGERWNEVFDGLPTLAFVYTSSQSGQRYSGLIRASRDRTGRRYPITVGCRTSFQSCSLGELPMVLAPFFDQAQAAVEDLEGGNSEHFEAKVEALQQNIDPSVGAQALRAALSSARGQSLLLAAATAGAPSADAPSTSRREVMLSELHDLTAQPANLAMHVPVSGQAHEIAFWLDLVEHWLPAGKPVTLAVWTPGRAGSLRLLYDRLVARYFEPMLWEGGDSDYEYNLMHAAPQREATVTRAHSNFGALDLELSTLADLLGQLQEVRIR